MDTVRLSNIYEIHSKTQSISVFRATESGQFIGFLNFNGDRPNITAPRKFVVNTGYMQMTFPAIVPKKNEEEVDFACKVRPKSTSSR